ncbi:hypothetical protein [Maridesulfovibrio salexigens]|uniref:GIY-YIG domain-containing protein n=1 Tax=Maridesulfovibrio salexigens (strain ATCC 14822 / DSM 2638 / NCIMB 8403 / VKM B-1763) TaxID=526222 RepID=C6BYV2_MARSD|nr:hypothetical protein [Maridesulfovibrio salexigens]ACS80709.1 hypothetical protein Desal_2655 [Maridesulfovibrio salexigens DSM 2638]
MFKQKNWPFTGKSGTEYTLGIFAKTRPIPEYGGVYILAYTHPRGHRAGFKVNVLYIGKTRNFRKELENPPQADRLWEGNWNCIYLLRIDEPERRKEVLADLVAGNEISCQ